MKSISMLVSNPYRPDPRVEREAKILAKSGYHVTIIAWDRRGELPAEEKFENIRVIRIQSVPSTYGAGASQLLRIPKFWLQAVRVAKESGADIIHCHDLDTLPAGWWLRRRTGSPLIFDAHEDYPALMSLYLPAWLVRLLTRLENFLLARTNMVITASTVLAERYRKAGMEPVISIPNVQDLAPFRSVSESQIKAARLELGYSPDDFIVVYIGGFSRNRLLLPLIQAGKLLPNVQILLWGDGHQRREVETAVQGEPNIRYLGWLNSAQVPLYCQMADVIYYALKPDYPGAIYNAPNTLSIAMAAGKPILCNNVGDLGRIVASTGCGLFLDHVTPEAIAEAISELQDPGVRQRLGEAGSKAAEDIYNLDAISNQLRSAYQIVFRSEK